MMISPYALLKASKPKTSADFVKPYDLYCAAQHAQSEHVSIDRESTPPQPFDVPPAEMPAGKTHYIRNIGIRHNQALRYAALSQTPID